MKITEGDNSVSVSVKQNASEVAHANWTETFTESVTDVFKEAIQYVECNVDVFLKHYIVTDGLFDDEALFAELRIRGQYKQRRCKSATGKSIVYKK